MTSMVYAYVSESYPTDVRATAASFVDACSGLLGILTSLTAGYLADLSRHYSWLFPTVTGAVCVIVTDCFFILEDSIGSIN